MKERYYALIGAGALGSHLGRALKRSGVRIIQVINRSSKTGLALADELGASYSEHTDDLSELVTHVLLTLPDQAIKGILPELPRRDLVLLHTSGSFSLNELKCYGHRVGVFYPSI